MLFTANDYKTGTAFFTPSRCRLHLLVKFKNHAEPDEFSGDLLDDLKTEAGVEYILNAETGEIIFDPVAGIG